jgi:hypothetical protein
MTLLDDWEFNVLGIYNYRQPGPLRHFYQYVQENHAHVPGDVLEAGVFRGRSLLATALLLKELGSAKKVYGFDSFGGFPPVYHPNDDLARFDDLRAAGRITPAHHEAVQRNRQFRSLALPEGVGLSAANISLSGDFSRTSADEIQRKAALLELDNIVLVPGPFEQTMAPSGLPDVRLMAALVDCDLYASYKACLPFIWPRLSAGGYVFLDEYYSLKFPGARIATNEFFAGQPDRPQMHVVERGDFERWFVRKIRGAGA